MKKKARGRNRSPGPITHEEAPHAMRYTGVICLLSTNCYKNQLNRGTGLHSRIRT